jgi:hypothetical protein
MSGGYFDYNQYKMQSIIERLEAIPKGRWYDEFSEETRLEFTNALQALNIALVYVERIDYLLSGDDGEASFHRRLKEGLEKCK